jgi:saccharopine dehydrogenase-like NADP-dependent oxidoreductase
MHTVLILGAGKIGELIACLLAESGCYQVHLGDISMDHFDVNRLGTAQNKIQLCTLDAKQPAQIREYVKQYAVHAILSSLPYYCNIVVAEVAKETQAHYFDLTEDISVTKAVTALAHKASTAFVPQCGLAPGFISIVANDLMSHFDRIDSVALRVGALPQQVNNALKYALTWSTEGLINEYGNPCHAIKNGQAVILQPLEGYETIEIDGMIYEAFNTSGGLGSLADTYLGKVVHMDYKTIRYLGHCQDMRLLMNDLKLNEDRDTLKRILERAVPKTYQDLVMIYVTVQGYQGRSFIEESYVKKIYPKTIAGKVRSAIQITTASSLCAIVDIVLANPENYQGLIRQEQFLFNTVINNQFGRNYRDS